MDGRLGEKVQYLVRLRGTTIDKAAASAHTCITNLHQPAPGNVARIESRRRISISTVSCLTVDLVHAHISASAWKRQKDFFCHVVSLCEGSMALISNMCIDTLFELP